MFPVLTRIFWLLVQPVTLAMLLLILGWLLSFRAKLGHEEEVSDFLRGARSLVAAEPKTTAWFAIRFDSWAGGH